MVRRRAQNGGGAPGGEPQREEEERKRQQEELERQQAELRRQEEELAALRQEYNPLVGVLGLYRVGWWPEEASTATGYGISLTLCLVIFVAGVLVFRKLEPRILKEV